MRRLIELVVKTLVGTVAAKVAAAAIIGAVPSVAAAQALYADALTRLRGPAADAVGWAWIATITVTALAVLVAVYRWRRPTYDGITWDIELRVPSLLFTLSCLTLAGALCTVGFMLLAGGSGWGLAAVCAAALTLFLLGRSYVRSVRILLG